MLVIGDVVGHDIAAAATMGQLRGLLRGIVTSTDDGPASALCHLDRSMAVLQINTLATAAVARFEQYDEEGARGGARLRWSNAGHPPPVLVSSGGTVTVLTRRPEMMLGVDPGTRRTDSVIGLAAGTTVLLSTDGLIERRDTHMDAGLDRLRRVLSELAALPLAALCDQLLERLVQGRPDDDVALVALRVHPRGTSAASTCAHRPQLRSGPPRW